VEESVAALTNVSTTGVGDITSITTHSEETRLSEPVAPNAILCLPTWELFGVHVNSPVERSNLAPAGRPLAETCNGPPSASAAETANSTGSKTWTTLDLAVCTFGWPVPSTLIVEESTEPFTAAVRITVWLGTPAVVNPANRADSCPDWTVTEAGVRRTVLLVVSWTDTGVVEVAEFKSTLQPSTAPAVIGFGAQLRAERWIAAGGSTETEVVLVTPLADAVTVTV
jgi:hypothetical protein